VRDIFVGIVNANITPAIVADAKNDAKNTIEIVPEQDSIFVTFNLLRIISKSVIPPQTPRRV
jgi:hypothetical protein